MAELTLEALESELKKHVIQVSLDLDNLEKRWKDENPDVISKEEHIETLYNGMCLLKKIWNESLIDDNTKKIVDETIESVHKAFSGIVRAVQNDEIDDDVEYLITCYQAANVCYEKIKKN